MVDKIIINNLTRINILIINGFTSQLLIKKN